MTDTIIRPIVPCYLCGTSMVYTLEPIDMNSQWKCEQCNIMFEFNGNNLNDLESIHTDKFTLFLNMQGLHLYWNKKRLRIPSSNDKYGHTHYKPSNNGDLLKESDKNE